MPAGDPGPQVSGGGLVARRALFRCGLSVRPFEALGLVQVVEAATGGCQAARKDSVTCCIGFVNMSHLCSLVDSAP
jgi:hypothetical protein